MNISEKERMKILGDLGEKIYANHCSSLGHKIHLSLNPFDMEKDILVDDKRKEIKTQTRYVVNNCCSLKLNQLEKCKKGFIWIECPTDRSPQARMWEIKEGFKCGKTKRKNGEVRYDVYMDQEKMVFIKDLSPEEYKYLKFYSTNYV